MEVIELAMKHIFGQGIDKKDIRDAGKGCSGLIGFSHGGHYTNHGACKTSAVSVTWAYGLGYNNNTAKEFHDLHTAAVMKNITETGGGLPPADLLGIAVPNVSNPECALVWTDPHAFAVYSVLDQYPSSSTSEIRFKKSPRTVSPYPFPGNYDYHPFWRITNLNGVMPSHPFLTELKELLHRGRCSKNSKLHVLSRDAIPQIMAMVCGDVPFEWVSRAFGWKGFNVSSRS
jgi:hypothetical protein